MESISENQKIASSESKILKGELAKKLIKADTLSTNNTAYYLVQKGDNLGNIAKKHNVTVEEIKAWNHLANDNVQLGLSLQVSKKETQDRDVLAPELKNVEYVVQKGENLWSISKKFGTSLSDLKQWNNLTDNTLAFGTTLTVAKNELAIATTNTTANSFKKNNSLAAASKKEGTNYLVKRGDSLFTIAKKYPGVSVADIQRWNGIKAADLKPGMKLKING